MPTTGALTTGALTTGAWVCHGLGVNQAPVNARPPAWLGRGNSKHTGAP